VPKIERDEKIIMSANHSTDYHEQGLEIPYRQISPETLQRMIQEFVTRDGADWADPGCTLEEKVEQVLQQLKTGQVKVVFDQTSQTANLISCHRRS
jgi:uncharacterized protein YheU (UPF0270 family)